MQEFDIETGYHVNIAHIVEKEKIDLVAKINFSFFSKLIFVENKCYRLVKKQRVLFIVMSEFTFELLTRALSDRVWKKKGTIQYISILSQKLISCLSIWLNCMVVGVHLQTNKQTPTVSAMLPATQIFTNFSWIMLTVSLLVSYVQIFSSLQHLEAMCRICQEQRCANTIPFLRKKS